MQSVLTWMGNKRLMTKKLLPLIPAHQSYCEVFAGSAALLLAKEPSSLEVLNDLDGELINFYRVARFHREALVEELEWMPRARAEFDDVRTQRGLTDIQRAARWLFLNKYSFGGKGESWGRKKYGPPLSRKNLLANIYALAERLHDVVLENQDWRGVLGFYDGPETFFFLDPPYVDTEYYASMERAWREEDHAELAAAVLRLKGSWVMTYNDHELVRELYAGCEMLEVEQTHSLPKEGSPGKMKQIIIMSRRCRSAAA
jgi:DNA adenine methylase